MSRSSLALVATAILLAAPDTPCGERVHQVLPGESASSISKRYYGTYDHATLLLRYNGRSDATIRPGEKLRVPWCEEHRVAPGDAWSSLAARYLGRASAWPAVAGLNGLVEEAPLRVGQRIVFPVLLEHRLQRGETLSILAERYYESPEMARLLARFNGVEDPRRLSVGQRLDVPLISMRLERQPDRGAAQGPTAPAPVSSGPSTEVAVADPAPEPPPVADPSPAPVEREEDRAEPASVSQPIVAAIEPLFADDLGAAAGAWREGDYRRVREMLESLRAPVQAEGTVGEQAEMWRLLTFVYVAYDREEDACRAWSALRELPVDPELDADQVSPKIRRAVAACAR